MVEIDLTKTTCKRVYFQQNESCFLFFGKKGGFIENKYLTKLLNLILLKFILQLMNKKEKSKVCGVEHAGTLDFKLRKFLQDPQKIVKPYVKEGMTVLDLGCGPGFFTVEMAKLVGSAGKVVAADLQDGMLDIVKKKIKNTAIQNTVEFHKCQKEKVNLENEFDFILLFYMLHEVPSQTAFLKEVHSLLKPDGRILIVEPKFHVSKKEFKQSKKIFRDTEFEIVKEPKVFFSRTALLKKENANEEISNSCMPNWLFSFMILSNAI